MSDLSSEIAYVAKTNQKQEIQKYCKDKKFFFIFDFFLPKKLSVQQPEGELYNLI